MTALDARSATAGATDAMRQVLRHNITRMRRVWWSPIVSGLAQPTLFLLAIGAGIGSQIDDTELARLGADSYLAWIGPGILAVTAMEICAREAMWPTMGMLKWHGSYRAVLHTPMSVGGLAMGHLAFIALRAVIAATCFLAVLVVAGVTASWWAMLTPAVAILIGLVHAGPIVAFTATLDHDHYFPALARVVIFPLFIFSGSFFPVDEMPAALAAFARWTPSWHGVEATRDLVSGRVETQTVGHLTVLVALSLVGIGLARRSFVRNVRP